MRNIVYKTLKTALAEKQALVNKVFTSQEKFDETFLGVEDIFIDGTEIPIERAKMIKNNEKVSVKKKVSEHNFSCYLRYLR